MGNEENKKSDTQKPEVYNFGGLKEYSLEQIEAEVLSESTYLDVFAGSDLRLKKDVQGLSGTLDSIQKLDAIKYQWNEEIDNHLTSDRSGTQVGLIAQQVAEVFPEIVKKDETTGYLTVNYGRLTTHLLVAIKELSEVVKTQNQRIADLEDLTEKLKN